jgi:hypothetical protein
MTDAALPHTVQTGKRVSLHRLYLHCSCVGMSVGTSDCVCGDSISFDVGTGIISTAGLTGRHNTPLTLSIWNFLNI